MSFRATIIGLLACVSLAWEADAQRATVSGRVISATSRRPVQQASIVLQDAEGQYVGTSTDENGLFTLPEVWPGRYILQVTYVGLKAYRDTLELGLGDRRRLQIELWPELYQAREVVVEEERSDEGTITTAGLTTIDPAALGRLPTPGLSPDLSAYLLTLPGVFAAADRGGQLYVRGGTPSQNLVLVDGMPLYQPFHVVGFYSAFPAEIVAGADVYAGGFGARYGGRISSVIDVRTRNGDKTRVRGSASLAPFLTSLRLEVPVVPEKVSLLFSGRESVLERVAPAVLGLDLPFRFGDYFAKLHAFLSRTSSFSATAIRTHDQGDLRSTSARTHRARWANEAYGVQYTYLPPEMPVLTRFSVHTSRLDSRQATTGLPDRDALVNGIHADILFSYLLGQNQLDIGIFGRTYGFRYDLGEGREEEYISEGGGYLDLRTQLGPNLRIEPGVRLQAYSAGLGTKVEPRARLTYRLPGMDGAHLLSFAWGRYQQQIMGLSSPRDLTESFIAWKPVPEHQSVPSSVHYIASWRGRLAPGVDFSLEGYSKVMRDQAFASYSGGARPELVVERLTGNSRGMDARLEFSRRRFDGFVGYGLARVKYRSADSGASFFPPHDRTHQLTALASAWLGSYRVSMQFQFGSGTPFTRIYGFFDQFPPGTTDIENEAGETEIRYANPYTGRLPTYHRLDVSIERTFRFERVPVTFQLGAVNVYDRRNLFNYDLWTGEHVYQLPIIPSVAIRVEV